MPELCPTCGNALPPTAPRGFCPTCLLRGGLTLPEMETTAFQAKIDSPAADSAVLEPVLGGHYQLGEKLGEGGFGVVYEAEQTEPLRRTVAIKILKPGMDTRNVIARFDAERQTLALMEHPHIARVLDAGETADGRPFFVMERVRGIPVTTFVQRLEIPLSQRLVLFALICDAVHHAHQKGIIHRDIKPSNILIEDDNGTPRPKVIDFGIAKALEGPMTNHTIFTGIDQILGTPGYISPEQIEGGAAAVDIRADVYALGALLYEMLCDAPVVDPASFSGKPLSQALKELATRKPPRPSQSHPELRGDLDAITLKALAADPVLRYASADALAEDVRRHLRHDPIQARAPSRLYLARKFVRRHRFGVAAAVSVLAAVLAGGITSTTLYLESEKKSETLRRNYSHTDYQTARQIGERGRHAESVTYLCRALRSDPGNATARSYLCSLLSHVHLAHSVAPGLSAPDDYDQLPLVGISAATGQAVAICVATKKAADGKSKPEMLSRWLYDSEERIDTELPSGTSARSMLVTPDGFHSVVGLSNGSLWLCNLISGDMTTLTPPMTSAITALAVTPDSRHLLCGTEAGGVQLWDLEKQVATASPLPLRGPIRQLIIGAQPDLAAAVSDAAVVVFDPATTRILSAPQNYDGLNCLAMQPQGERLVVGSQRGIAQLRVMGSGQFVGVPLGHDGAVMAAAFSASGRVFVTGDQAGLLYPWHSDTGRPAGPSQEMDGPVVFCQSTRQRDFIMSVSGMGELRLWNPLSGIITTQRMRKNVRTAAMSGAGTHVAVALRDEPVVHVWELHGRMIEPRYFAANSDQPTFAAHLHRPPPEGVAPGRIFRWNASGTHSAHLNEDGTVTVTPSTRAPLRVAGNAIALALSNDARLVAVGGADRSVRLWNTVTGHQSAPALQHNTAVQHIAFTPDGLTLATVTEDGELRCWDTRSGDPLMPPVNRGEKAKAVATTADGTQLCYQRESGGWFVLPLPLRPVQTPEWFLQLAEAMVRRRLTTDTTIESLSHESLREAVARIPRTPAEEERPLVTLARWLVSNPTRRPLWPGDKGEFADYIARLIRIKESAALHEALRFDPLNEEAIRLLREAK